MVDLQAKAALTVFQLTRAIKVLIRSDAALRDVWVRGELSNFKLHTSGHAYFTLKDERAAIRCVMWQERVLELRFRPQNGLEVLVRGYVDVFERDGQYQLYVQEMEPAGLGGLHLALEQLKARLAAEGLFDPARKRPLPVLPRRIALVTSPTGAALRDMIRVARRRFPNVHLVVIPVLVQGPEAPADIVRGLRIAGGIGADVVIVGRGGGSLEELWAFNEEAVARAIRACPVPVVSAVGHETDFTIADLAADVRAPTPSAAAEMVVPERSALDRALAVAVARARRAMAARLRRERQRLDILRSRRVLEHPRSLLDGPRQRLDLQVSRLAAALRAGLAARRGAWRAAAGRLDALSPLATLRRGFAICRREDGTVVRRAEQVTVGEGVEVLLAEGSLGCRVERRGPGFGEV